MPFRAPALIPNEERRLRSGLSELATALGGVTQELSDILESLVYLGPLRSAPQRFYERAAKSGTPGDGRDVAVYLFDNSSVLNPLNEWLAKLEVPYTLDVVPVSAAGDTGIVGDLVALTL